jgi:hypothetical protein
VVFELPDATGGNGPSRLDTAKGKEVTFNGYFRLWNEGHWQGPIAPSNPHHVLEVHPAWGFTFQGGSFENKQLVRTMASFTVTRRTPLFKAASLNSPVLGLTPTPSGKGYWLFARDGGIFSFGDAKFFGSTGGIRLNRPIVGMAARPQGDGYWMVAADGGLFTFGRAPYLGSGASPPRSSPCVAMGASTSGNGYALLLANGAVLPYGDVPYLGSAAGRMYGSAVGMAGNFKPLS